MDEINGRTSFENIIIVIVAMIFHVKHMPLLADLGLYPMPPKADAGSQFFVFSTAFLLVKMRKLLKIKLSQTLQVLRYIFDLLIIMCIVEMALNEIWLRVPYSQHIKFILAVIYFLCSFGYCLVMHGYALIEEPPIETIGPEFIELQLFPEQLAEPQTYRIYRLPGPYRNGLIAGANMTGNPYTNGPHPY